jgi:hypothetical protein
MTSQLAPLSMEDYFQPGYITRPAVHIGSQSMRLYIGDEEEQAIEGIHLAAANKNDVVVVRNIDPAYIKYWEGLVGKVHVINLATADKKSYLSKIILGDKKIIKEIKNRMNPTSALMVYFPTSFEEKVAKRLGIKLHGSRLISKKYGTKTGIRELAHKNGLPMPEGRICLTKEDVANAINALFEKYDTLIVKHALSSAGRWMRKINKGEYIKINSLLNKLSGGKFIEGKDTFVVEAWINSKASLCAHIEITENEEPVVAAAWEQIIDSDGITYVGAGPLKLSPKAMESFMKQVTMLAYVLKENGAIGSYGPDFIITDESQSYYPPDTSLLIELNARTPVTPFALEIVKQIRGRVGSGFLTQNIRLSKKHTFKKVRNILTKEKLLITKAGPRVSGVVPYNIGLLNWNRLYYVVMADTWQETLQIANKVKQLFP